MGGRRGPCNGPASGRCADRPQPNCRPPRAAASRQPTPHDPPLRAGSGRQNRPEFRSAGIRRYGRPRRPPPRIHVAPRARPKFRVRDAIVKTAQGYADTRRDTPVRRNQKALARHGMRIFTWTSESTVCPLMARHQRPHGNAAHLLQRRSTVGGAHRPASRRPARGGRRLAGRTRSRGPIETAPSVCRRSGRASRSAR